MTHTKVWDDTAPYAHLKVKIQQLEQQRDELVDALKWLSGAAGDGLPGEYISAGWIKEIADAALAKAKQEGV